jgi:hypothetical protein
MTACVSGDLRLLEGIELELRVLSVAVVETVAYTAASVVGA